MGRLSNFVIYTAVFGNYDHVLEVNPVWECDFICFTDNPELVSSGWQIFVIELNGEPPAEMNRRYKMMPHKYLEDYECSLYVDASIKIVADPTPLFRKYLDTEVIAIPKHQDRNCAYIEAQYCLRIGLVNEEITNRQMSRYAKDGFPKRFGMTENGVIFRRHHDENVISLMDAWWVEYCCGVKRDQISLPYLIWKYKINVLEVIEGPLISTKFFELDLHTVDKSKPFIRRLAKYSGIKKHISYYYLIIFTVFSLIVAIRDSKLNRMLRKRVSSLLRQIN